MPSGLPPSEGAVHQEERQLQMKYAGGMIRHLGLQMYGGAVPAIAELIANSWDADASRVEITIPLDRPIEQGLSIEVLDDGTGMSFEDIDDNYLLVGLDRRRSGRPNSSGGRKVMGRKGIGKLAGFGIAKTMRVESKRNGLLTSFEMNFEEMTSADQYVRPYGPKLVHDGPDEGGVIPYESGTRVILKDLVIRNAVNPDRFRLSMSRRFSILSNQFEVVVNEEPLTSADIDLDFRFPDADVEIEHIPGFGTVKCWVGFAPKPISHEEARGIVVMVRGKLAQAPFFFDQTRGTQGQLGLQYMTGEVHADDLDDLEDLIATDRSSIRWEHERAQPLLIWGQEMVRKRLQEWSRLRRQRNEEYVEQRLRARIPQLDRIRQLPDSQQRELFTAVDSLTSVETIDQERLNEIVDFLLRAYENDHLLNLIRQINSADSQSLEQLRAVVDEWDVLEAIAVAQVVRGRIAMVDKFKELIDEDAPELPDMRDFIETHPWALRPEWSPLERERSLERVLEERLGGSASIPRRKGRRRIDALCLASPGIVVVVELKRPGDISGRDELRQLEDYVDCLRQHQDGSSRPGGSRQVFGFLVYGRLRDDIGDQLVRLTKDGIYVESWDKLWEDAERLHRDYLRVMKSRASADDSRIAALDRFDEDTQGADAKETHPVS